jgi:hydroxypyruvate isomerase
MPRFAANLSFLFTELPFLNRFDAAAKAGFDAVEFAWEYAHSAEEIRRAARDARVRVVLINAPAGDFSAGEFGLAALPGREDAHRESVERALAYANVLDCKRVHVLAGMIAPANGEAIASYRSNVTLACGAAAPASVDILLEPINDRSKPGYFLNSYVLAEQVITAIARPNLKLLFDIFHRQILHGDVLHAFKRLLPIVGHVQVSSAPDRREPDSGELADSYIFAALDALGYSGWIGAEYNPSDGDTAARLGWFKPYARR